MCEAVANVVADLAAITVITTLRRFAPRLFGNDGNTGGPRRPTLSDQPESRQEK